MCLLDFIEEHHGVRLASHGLSQLAALIIAHISRRCPHKTAYGMLLLIFRHIDTGHHVLVIEEVFGQSFRQLGLADTGSAQENERADRATRVVQAGTRAAHSIGDRRDGLILPYHTVMQLCLEMEQLLLLALHHFVDGDSGPARHNVSDILRIHLLLDQSLFALHHPELLLDIAVLLLFLLYARIADFSHFGIIPLALGAVGLEVELLDVDFVLLHLVDKLFLGLPLGGELFLLLAHCGEVFLNLAHLLLVALALDCLALNLLLGYHT